MKQTIYWKIDDKNNEQSKQMIKEAAKLLQAGKLVAFPTETVYGLGADATNERAISQIFKAKGRPQDNPLIVHVANKSQIKKLVKEINPVAEQLIDAFSPGPMTFVLQDRALCANNVSAGLSTIAVRVPSHPIALQLLEISGLPLAAPSANQSGKPSPTTANHVYDDLAGKISGIIDGGPTDVGMESTVIDCTTDQPVILRPGSITQEMIEEQLGFSVKVAPEIRETNQPSSPGVKYPHYAPEVPLILGSNSTPAMQQLISQYEQQGNRVGVLAREPLLAKLHAAKKVSLGTTLGDVGQQLYEGLRSFKKTEVELIVCETFDEKGLGRAIMNRLKKAAKASGSQSDPF